MSARWLHRQECAVAGSGSCGRGCRHKRRCASTGQAIRRRSRWRRSPCTAPRARPSPVVPFACVHRTVRGYSYPDQPASRQSETFSYSIKSHSKPAMQKYSVELLNISHLAAFVSAERRVPRSETTEPANAERQSASAIDPYAFQLSGWLKTEAAKSRKQRRSLKQLVLITAERRLLPPAHRGYLGQRSTKK